MKHRGEEGKEERVRYKKEEEEEEETSVRA